MEIKIEKLGARGDGIAHINGEKTYVAFALPGENIDVTIGQRRNDGHIGIVNKIITPSSGRITPVCQYFKKCGGCVLQHLNNVNIASFKRQNLIEALKRKGFDDTELSLTKPTISIDAGLRRRVRLSCLRLRGRVIIGFNMAASKNIIDIQSCHVVDQKINDLLTPLRKICSKISSFGNAFDIQITLSENGADITFHLKKLKGLSLDERLDLADFAHNHEIARLAIDLNGLIEPIVAMNDILVDFGGNKIALPVGGFLQPSKAGEDIIASLVASAVADADKIADLYSGCGSLTFPIAENSNKPKIHAVDGANTQINALRKAAGGTRITTEIRDLAKNPLGVDELNKFDAVVFDPPRIGAMAQAKILAKSDVKKIIAVSCNPASLARDLQILATGGYKIRSITPIDQFTWSFHVEALVILSR